MRIVIDPQKCTASGECVIACPQNAISIQEGVAVVDDGRCDYDGICIPVCPHHAISFEE